MTRDDAFDLISAERERQFNLWGHTVARMENPDTSTEWKAAVVGEEFGEVCKEVVEGSQQEKLRREIVHLAAVCTAWLEAMPL